MELQSLILKNFNKGWVNRIPAEEIPDEAWSYAQNINRSERLLPIKAKGHAKYNATTMGAAPVRGSFVYTMNDGTKYYIVACNGFLWYSLAGSGTFAKYQIGGGDLTISTVADFEFVQYNNCVYAVCGLYPVITNGGYTTMKMLKISGTTPSSITATDLPQAARLITVHQERIFVVVGNNELYWSNPYTPETWTPTDGLNYDYTGKDDGESIAGIISYGSYLYAGKPHNIYRYSTIGDISGWGSSRVDTPHGWIYNRALQRFFGQLIYLSYDGVYLFDGNNAVSISEEIRDQILALPQLRTNIRQWLQTTTADFTAGTYGAKLVDVSGDEVKPLPQTLKADWDAGTLTNVETAVSSGDVKIATASGIAFGTNLCAGKSAVDENGNSVTEITDSNYNTGRWYNTVGTPDATVHFSYAVDLGASRSIKRIKPVYQNVKRTTMVRVEYSTDGVTWTTCTGTLGALPYLEGNKYEVIYTLSATITARYVLIAFEVSRTFPEWATFVVYELECYEPYISTGNILTQTLDFGFTPNALGNLSCEVSVPTGTTLLFQTQSSADGNTWDALSNIGSAGENGGAINSTARRYLRWKALFTANTNLDATPTLSAGYVGVEYISSKKDFGAAITSWGLFESSYITNGSTATFWLRSATSAANLDAATWYQQSPGNIITGAAVNQHVQWSIRLNALSATTVPYVESVQVNGYIGTQLLQPCSYVKGNDFGLNITPVGGSNNSQAYVYNRECGWSLRTNKSNNVYVVDEDKLISGTSESDGFVRLNETGSLDDATAIVSYFETKNFELAEAMKIFKYFFVTSRSGSSWTFSYSVDNGTYVDITIDARADATTIKKMFAGIARGRFIKFKVYTNADDSNWTFHGINVKWAAWRQLNTDE